MKGLVKAINKYLVADSRREDFVKRELMKLKNNCKILDVGAGEQRYKKYCMHLDYTSQDFCQYTGMGNGSGLQNEKWDVSKIDIVSDIINIPVESHSFDAILCTEVFEHIPDPISALKEFSRILKPGGILILSAPFCSLTHMAPYHYYSGLNRYWYEYFMPKNNFEIVTIESNGNFFEYIMQESFRCNSVYREYFGKPLSILWLGICYLFGRKMHKISNNNNKSDELLCFGYHVVAKRNDN